MKQGIILIACGHPYYGKMAAAVAASIKAVENVSICLLHHGKAVSYLDEKELALFDIKEILSDDLVSNADGSFNPLKARMHMYDLTPFEETLMLDVDNIWLKKKPSEVFESLKEVSFTIQNTGYTLCDAKADEQYSVWADINDIIKAYKLQGKKFYQTLGEWIYFKKDNKAKKLFTAALKIFNAKPKIKVHSFIGQTVPDELAFSIAMALTDIYPHADKYLPTTFFDINSLAQNRFSHIYQLTDKYFTISLGSNRNPVNTVTMYNTLSAAAYQKLGLQNPYKWKSKKTFLPERIKL